MAILWGSLLALGTSGCPSYADICRLKFAILFAIIPLMIWLYAANRFRYAKQLSANQWIGLFVTAFFGVLPIPRFLSGG